MLFEMGLPLETCWIVDVRSKTWMGKMAPWTNEDTPGLVMSTGKSALKLGQYTWNWMKKLWGHGLNFRMFILRCCESSGEMLGNQFYVEGRDLKETFEFENLVVEKLIHIDLDGSYWRKSVSREEGGLASHLSLLVGVCPFPFWDYHDHREPSQNRDGHGYLQNTFVLLSWLWDQQMIPWYLGVQ